MKKLDIFDLLAENQEEKPLMMLIGMLRIAIEYDQGKERQMEILEKIYKKFDLTF